MRTLVTSDEMAAADGAAVASGTSVETLMDRAGRAVARTAIRMMEGRYGKKVVVVCGKGNNGGDGYAAARVLHQEGVHVRCLSVEDPDGLTGAARAHFEAAVQEGVSVTSFDRSRLTSDLVIDAIYGTGLAPRREGVPDDYFSAIQAIADLRRDADEPEIEAPLVLAVDIPSGISGLHGPIMHPVHADVTVTFASEKLGAFVSDPRYTGEVEVADIGIQPKGWIEVMERADVAARLPRRPTDSHKRSAGSLLAFVGSDAMPGAAALVVRGAMRAGCGYVTVACTPGVADVVRKLCPEAIVRVVGDADHLGPGALDRLEDVIERATVVAVGPGLGTGDDQTALVDRIIDEVDLPLVLDADGLNVLAGRLDDLSAYKGRIAITPHPVELARLMDVDVRSLDDPVAAARQAVARSGCEVILKGYRSVIAGPDDDPIVFVTPEDMQALSARDDVTPGRGSPFVRTLMNPTGGPELATAGTGDVLTGVVATFLFGNPVERSTEAVAAAAYVHGLAGQLAGEGAVAWDVAEALPEAIHLIRDGSLL